MQRLWLAIRVYFSKLLRWPVQRPTLAQHHLQIPPAQPVPPRKPRDKSAAEDAQAGGRFYYLGDLLDKLDEAFKYLRYLKKDDPDAYALYRSVGGGLVPDATELLAEGVEPALIGTDKLPAFFHMNFLGDDHDDKIALKLLYFQKLKHFAPIQRSNGTIYSATAYYVDQNAPDKLRAPMEFFVAVSEDGITTPLKVATNWDQRVKHRRADRDRVHYSTIPRRSFKLPHGLTVLSEENHVSIDFLVQTFFSLAAAQALASESGFSVRVSKNGLSARFAIDMLRTPYFFKDRDQSVKGKKIFHIVRTHGRVLSDGTETTVRSHFRGLRQFAWNGYDVTITMPGLHHAPLYDATFTALDEQDPDAGKEKTASMEQAGAMIAERITRAMPNNMAGMT